MSSADEQRPERPRTRERRRRRGGPASPAVPAAPRCACRAAPVCHQTIAPPTSAAATQRLPARPDVRRGQRDEPGEGEQPDADEQPRPVAVALQRLGGDRVLDALVGHHEPGGDVEQDAGAAGERQRDEADPVDHRVEVEVAAEPGGRRRRASGRRATGQAPRLCRGVGMVSVVSVIVSLQVEVSTQRIAPRAPRRLSGIARDDPGSARGPLGEKGDDVVDRRRAPAVPARARAGRGGSARARARRPARRPPRGRARCAGRRASASTTRGRAPSRRAARA